MFLRRPRRAGRLASAVTVVLLVGAAVPACLPSASPPCNPKFSLTDADSATCPPPPELPPPCPGCPGVTGDPHVKTFDGRGYDMQGAGEFTAVIADDLEVQVRTEPTGEAVSAVTAVAMKVDGARVTVAPTGTTGEATVQVDGAPVDLADSSDTRLGDGVMGFGPDGEVLVRWGDGSLVVVHAIRARLNVLFDPIDERRAAAEGLMGVPDGDTTNDWTTRDGETLPYEAEHEEFYDVFVNSWRITDETSLFDYGPDESTATYTDLDFPPFPLTLDDLDPRDRAEAERICRDAGVTNGAVLDDCILDVATTGDPSYAEDALFAQQRLTDPEGDGSVAGMWTTTYGPMEFTVDGDRVTGVYLEEDGVFEGTVDGTTFHGVWAEPSSAVTCDSQRLGFEHWGQFEFVFDDDFEEFEGSWGYCDRPLDDGWDGERSAGR